MTDRACAIALLTFGVVVGCDRGDVPCPTGYTRDVAREARLREDDGGAAPHARTHLTAVCFGPLPTLGAIAGQIALLSRDASDAELTARLAHLEVHAADGLGDGCARGAAAARASEARAQAVEAALRAERRLPPLAPGEALNDYAARCR